MTQLSNVGASSPPLTARQIVASTLLGVDPPRLPSRQLVRAGELFGIAEGATRVALSRMVRAGELVATDGWYELAGHLLEHQARQAEGRHPRLLPWSGDWCLDIVRGDRRPAAERTALRTAMRGLRYAEQREGVWTRPDNLDPERLPDARSVRDAQCDSLAARPRTVDARSLAERLWDLEAWSTAGRGFLRALDASRARLDRGDRAELAAGWELSAAVLRHLLADPLLPAELLPAEWPGDGLRTLYDGYDFTFKRVWREAFVEV
jgi:phenylacetic acid degradation operon negative regulatory protein